MFWAERELKDHLVPTSILVKLSMRPGSLVRMGTAGASGTQMAMRYNYNMALPRCLCSIKGKQGRIIFSTQPQHHYNIYLPPFCPHNPLDSQPQAAMSQAIAACSGGTGRFGGVVTNRADPHLLPL